MEGTYSTQYSFAVCKALVLRGQSTGQDSTFCGLKSTGTANASDGNRSMISTIGIQVVILHFAQVSGGATIDPATTDDNHPVKILTTDIFR